MAWDERLVKPHGTTAAARRHYRRGEKPCELCREAMSRDWLHRPTRPALNERKRQRRAADKERQ